MSNLLTRIRNRYDIITKAVLFLITIGILVVVFPKERKFRYEFQKGKPWLHEDLIAPFNFAIFKTKEELTEEQAMALERVHPYFNYIPGVAEDLRPALAEDFEKRWAAKYGEADMFLNQKLQNRKAILSVFDSIFDVGILRLNPVIENQPDDFDIILVADNVATEKSLGELFTLQSAGKAIRETLKEKDFVDTTLAANLLLNVLAHNVFYDEQKTLAERDAALEEISQTKGLVQKGELIISKGELIDGPGYQVLQSLKKNYESQIESDRTYFSVLAGQIIVVSIAILVLFLIMIYYRKDVAGSLKKLILILSLVITMVLLTKLMVDYQLQYLYILPFCIVPIIIRAFFDTRLALYVHLIMVILAAFLVPDSFQFVFLQLIAGAIGVFSMYNLEKRSRLFLTSLWIFVSYALIYTGKTLIQEGDISGLDPLQYAMFAGSAFLVLFAFPLIFIFEKVFSMITDFTLIELSNTNNKLLRELAQRAPGTFQHSLQVANLAEEAIYKIGGNALLVRVGALYHDIGKMDEPIYFIENQRGGVNPHDELTYEESAQIIINHVIRGIEMAKKHNLPEDIIDFIRTHHGTRKVEFFYFKQKKDFPDDVNDKTFTYPGPIPFSRETAILMMADSVEAASRSLDIPDEKSIDKLVEGIISKQVETDQFINSDITLRDITTVKKILKEKLKNIYHVRIAYPE
jgi:hypothetical protein